MSPLHARVETHELEDAPPSPKKGNLRRPHNRYGDQCRYARRKSSGPRSNGAHRRRRHRNYL